MRATQRTSPLFVDNGLMLTSLSTQRTPPLLPELQKQLVNERTVLIGFCPASIDSNLRLCAPPRFPCGIMAGGLVCSLCFEDMMPGTDLESTICAHTFHRECLLEAFQFGPRRCPICKMDQPLPPPVVVPAAPPPLVVVDEVPSPSLRRFRAEFPSAFETDSENGIDGDAVVESDEHMDDGEMSGDGAGDDEVIPWPKAKAKSKGRAKAKPIAAKASAKAKGKAKAKPAAAKGKSAASSRGGSADRAATDVGGGGDEHVHEDMDMDVDDGVAGAIPSPKAKGKGKAKAKAKRAAAKAKAKAIAKSKGKSKAKAKPAAAKAKPTAAQAKAKATAAPIGAGASAVGSTDGGSADGPGAGASGSNDVLVPTSHPGNSLASMAFGQVMCGSCGRANHFSSVRLLNKGNGYYKCNGCFVKTSQLRRLLGSWPSQQFTSLPKDRGWLLVHTFCTSSEKPVPEYRCCSPGSPSPASKMLAHRPSGATAANERESMFSYPKRTSAVVELHPIRHIWHFGHR